MCFETACSVIANGSASSSSVAGPLLRRATIARRTGSARQERTVERPSSSDGCRGSVVHDQLILYQPLVDYKIRRQTEARQGHRIEISRAAARREVLAGEPDPRPARVDDHAGQLGRRTRERLAELLAGHRRRLVAAAERDDLERVRVQLDEPLALRGAGLGDPELPVSPTRFDGDPELRRASARRRRRTRWPAVRSRDEQALDRRAQGRRRRPSSRAGPARGSRAPAPKTWSSSRPSCGPASTCPQHREHRLAHRRGVGVAVLADARLQAPPAAVGERRSCLLAHRGQRERQLARPCDSSDRASPLTRRNRCPCISWRATSRRSAVVGRSPEVRASASTTHDVVAQAGDRLRRQRRRLAARVRARRGCVEAPAGASTEMRRRTARPVRGTTRPRCRRSPRPLRRPLTRPPEPPGAWARPRHPRLRLPVRCRLGASPTAQSGLPPAQSGRRARPERPPPRARSPSCAARRGPSSEPNRGPRGTCGAPRPRQSFSIGAILIRSFLAPALSKRTCATRFAPSPVTASTRPSPKSS